MPDSCFIMCYDDISKLESAFNRIKEKFKNDDNKPPLKNIRISQCLADIMYPLYLMVIFEEKDTEEIDIWLYELGGLDSGEICCGYPRLMEINRMEERRIAIRLHEWKPISF